MKVEKGLYQLAFPNRAACRSHLFQTIPKHF
jgi:hypothetical protein